MIHSIHPLPASDMDPTLKGPDRSRDTDEGTERYCSRCNDWWPEDIEFFQRKRGGWHCWCRACFNEARAERRAAEALQAAAITTYSTH